MGRITRALFMSFAMLAVAVPAAAADTLPGRDSPFTPSQAVADQYLGPPATPRSPGAGGVGAAGVGPSGVAGEDVPGQDPPESGVGAEDTGRTPVAGQGPALVDSGATAPGRPGGTLPFTGSDLLMLVWIALALVAAGTVIEVARRRYEAARARATT